MYLSIIFLPLLGCIASGFFGRKVGVDGARLITSLSVIITTILAILGFFEIGFNNLPVTINLFRWVDSEWYNIIWGFQFDSLTVSMLIPVLIISSLVHIYSISYMSADPLTKNMLGICHLNFNKSRLAIKPFIGKRYYSIISKTENKDFFDWLCGLTDGEGSFMLLKKQDSYGFKFQIQLHIDDIKVLHYIQSTLGVGKVYLNGSAAQFVVTNSKDLAVILDIFSRYPLNTTKLLNFLDFKKAYEIYKSSRLKSSDILEQVEEIRIGMNSLIFNFSLLTKYAPTECKVRVTPYWLLGFVEGEGSFCVRNNFTLI